MDLKLDFLESGINLSENEFTNKLPRAVEQLIPLSFTGISHRNFHHWKESDLITLPEPVEKSRVNVRLNLAEYIWIKLVEYLRNVGLSIKLIREIKTYLFQDALSYLIKNDLEEDEKLNEIIKSNPKLRSTLYYLKTKKKELENLPDHYRIYSSLFGGIVTRSFLFKENVQLNILLHETNGQFHPEVIISGGYYDELFKYDVEANQFNNKPHIRIPILSLFHEFFKSDVHMDYSNKIGLLTKEEEELISIIKDNQFKEISIKKSKDERFIIDIINDDEIMNEKLAELRKLLGLKQYQEITLVHRNDKHAYVKKKIRKIL